MDVRAANNVLVSLVLDQFSDKVSGAVSVDVQGSNDGQNWSSLGTVVAAAADAGTEVLQNITAATRFVRLVTKASPGGNTVSFAVATHLSQI